MLFGMDGIEICICICVELGVFIIMFMVCSDMVDVVRGFEVGVDDYMVKFFNLKEFVVCICICLWLIF